MLQYKDPNIAKTMPDGLAVLAVLVKTGRTHPELKKVCEQLSCIRYKSDTVHGQNTIDINKVIPGELTQVHY